MKALARSVLRGAGAAGICALLMWSVAVAADERPSLDPTAATVSAATPSGTSSTTSGELPAALPLRRGSEPALPTGGMGIPGLIVLVGLLALVVGWAGWRRRGRGAGRKALSIRELLKPQRDGVQLLQSVRLTAHTSVHVIEWNGRQHLLACGESAVAAIADREVTPNPSPGMNP